MSDLGARLQQVVMCGLIDLCPNASINPELNLGKKGFYFCRLYGEAWQKGDHLQAWVYKKVGVTICT